MDIVLLIVFISVIGPIIGSLCGVLIKPTQGLLVHMLAFAAGVMITISFTELIPRSIAFSSVWISVFGVITGALLMFGIDKMIPHFHPDFCLNTEHGKLKRTAAYLLLGIFFHNFPEGMAIAVGTVSSAEGGFMIALAIAIHNIPEGICTSAPQFQATKRRWRSFFVSSTIAIPVLAGFLIAKYFYQIIPLSAIGCLIGATAGLMIYISADELIPSSCCRVTSHTTIFSLIGGMIFVMLLGLI